MKRNWILEIYGICVMLIFVGLGVASKYYSKADIAYYTYAFLAGVIVTFPQFLNESVNYSRREWEELQRKNNKKI